LVVDVALSGLPDLTGLEFVERVACCPWRAVTVGRSTCKFCGASRELLDEACPYCGRAYEEALVGGDLYQEIMARRGTLFECEATKRFPFWAHLDCRLRITRDELIFDDFDDDAYSFAIPVAELRRARIEKPRGWLASGDDLLIILEDGTEYEIGLEEGVKPKVLEILRAIWEREG
jgi:hypothetical protein